MYVSWFQKTIFFISLLAIVTSKDFNEYPCKSSSNGKISSIGYILTDDKSFTYGGHVFRIKQDLEEVNLKVYKNSPPQKVGKFTLKNIPAVLAHIDDVLNSDFLGHGTGIYFGICPSTTSTTSIYYPYGYTNNLSVRNYDFPTRCSLWHCEMGLYIQKKDTTKFSLLDQKSVDYVFFIGFKNRKDRKPFLLDQFTYGKLQFYLYACPYYNWVAKLSLTGFEPSPYLENDNGFLHRVDESRHIFTPIYQRKKSDGYFICGEIVQPDQLERIPVGYGITYDANLKLSSILVNNNYKSTACNDIKLSPEFTFSYSPEGLNFEDQNAFMRYMGKKMRFYSGQYLMGYNLEEIKSIAFGDGGGSSLQGLFERDKKVVKPSCIKKVLDVNATLRFKFNSKVLPQKKYNIRGKKVEYLTMKKIKSSDKYVVGCHAVPDDYLEDERFEDFYLYRYRTKLHKGRFFKGKKNMKNIQFLNGQQHPYEIYGYFHCLLDVNKKIDYIKASEFFIIPDSQVNVVEIVEASAIPSTDTACNMTILEIADLKEMNVQEPGEGIVHFKYAKEKFSDYGGYRIYRKLEGVNANGTVIECYYTAFGKDFMKVKKIIIFDSAKLRSELKKRNIIIGVISVVSIIILILLVIITLYTFTRIKNKKRSNLFSLASSTSSASSFSRSSTPTPKMDTTRNKANESKNKSKTAKNSTNMKHILSRSTYKSGPKTKYGSSTSNSSQKNYKF
uniref:Peptidase A1 domain-containing protein n=1 Tax=Parastrongyloides trichosuri TaxID=131310 RepID=A0A0N4ZKD7_PARTI